MDEAIALPVEKMNVESSCTFALTDPRVVMNPPPVVESARVLR